MNLLSVRSRSREELRRRLLRVGYDPEEIDPALADLERVGLIDDERFAQEVAESMRRRGMGRRAGISALRAKGVAAEVAELAAEEIDQGDEESRAEEVARTRLRRLGGLRPEVAGRRLLGFLLRRGFDPQAARAACRRVLEEEREAS